MFRKAKELSIDSSFSFLPFACGMEGGFYMKKLIMVMFSLCMLIAVSGCQTSNDELSPNEFTEQFVNDFFSFKYDENLNETESYSHLEGDALSTQKEVMSLFDK